MFEAVNVITWRNTRGGARGDCRRVWLCLFSLPWEPEISLQLRSLPFLGLFFILAADTCDKCCCSSKITRGKEPKRQSKSFSGCRAQHRVRELGCDQPDELSLSSSWCLHWGQSALEAGGLGWFWAILSNFLALILLLMMFALRTVTSGGCRVGLVF